MRFRLRTKHVLLVVVGAAIGLMGNLVATAITTDETLWPGVVALVALCGIEIFIYSIETEDEEELRLYRESRQRELRYRLEAIRRAEQQMTEAFERGDYEELKRWRDQRDEFL
jgi:hypothetical protein